MQSFCLLILLQISLICFNDVNCLKNDINIRESSDEVDGKIERGLEIENDDAAKLYLLLKRFMPSSSRMMTGKRYDDDDSLDYEYDVPSVGKRVIKLLRVGRSIGSMAHRLPRMGKK